MANLTKVKEQKSSTKSNRVRIEYVDSHRNHHEKGNFKEFLRELKKNRNLYFLMAPYLLLFFIFTVFPIIISIIISLTNFDGVNVPEFIAFENYRRLFLSDKVFLKAIQNTFVIAIFVGPIGYIMSFLMAWLLNELPKKLRTILTVVFYSPSIAGNVYLIWTLIFSGDAYGYLNALLYSFGIIDEPILWLKDEKTMMFVVVLVSLWLSLGVGFLSFIAGLQGVDRGLFEAAEVDGIKNRWQELWYITLPSMKPQLMFGAVMSVTNSLAVADVTVGLNGFPSPNYATHTIVNHLNDFGILRLELGYASSIAFLLFFIMMIVNLLIQKFLKRVGK